jgi:hypothetical protein
VAEKEDESQPEAEPVNEMDQARQQAAKILSEEPKPGAVEGDTPEVESPEPSDKEPKEKPAAEPASDRFKITVKAEDGSDAEVEVDIDGLKRGYMMEKDYRAKTAQLARAREEVEAKIKGAIEPKLKEYDDKLQLAEQVIWHTLAPEIQNTDWNKLAVEDPALWAQKMQLANNVNAKLNAIKQERIKISEEQAKQQTKELQKIIQESNDTLKDPIKGIPGWNQEVYGRVLTYGQAEGFKAEEVNTITDPRVIKLLWKASKYDDLQKAKPAVEKLVTKVPKVLKPGTTEKSDGDTEAWRTGMARLKKSGADHDARALASILLEREGVKN